ncbi:hypothetical protein [Ciceribacter ferrooxidans]|uniref:Biotin transporter BioY n=1 Tax=Ciceribacter ferrooxidans TaxID=2509717 RepID=A0A4Q2T0C1_9HYPH|nr:hypothetical protein [Ciceribacter ferrooxidans]RYC10019.1 hypothetical protein EUU22_18240 [Ciceribacter ferrooxidans]
MNGLEAAIRNALERSDRTNAETRARIYQSARHALETGLQKQGITDPEIIAQQRHKLEATIHAIELEERGRLPAVESEVRRPLSGDLAAELSQHPAAPAVRAVREPAVPAVEPGPGERREGAAAASDFGDLRAERLHRGAESVDTSMDRNEIRTEATAMEVRPETPIHPRKKRRGLFARLFMLAVLLGAMGTGAWWVYTSGLMLSEAERDTSVPNPPPQAVEEDFSGTQEPKPLETRNGFSDEWIEIFEPKRIDVIRPRANAAVDVVTARDGTAMNVVSRSADADGNVEITVPTDALREMAGKTSTFALTVEASGDQPVQIAVECDFGRLGDCARHRFTVDTQKTDVLFRVTFDRSMAPATPGRLLLNAGLGGAGQGVNLYSVRLLPGQ